MARGVDATKWREWKVRWERYRASGLTIGRFCEREGVSVNTFHYWARRVGRSDEKYRGIQRVPTLPAEQPAVVRFRLSSAVEVSVPAHCLEVIRCLAAVVQQAKAPAAFQEVVVAHR